MIAHRRLLNASWLAILLAGCVAQAPPPAPPPPRERPVTQDPQPAPQPQPQPEPQPEPYEELGTPEPVHDYARWVEEDKRLPKPPSKTKAAIAVAPFTFHRNVRAKPGTELETATLTKKFITELGQVRKFDIVERDQLDRLLDEMELSEAGFTDPNRAVKAGKLYGVDYFLMGEISVWTVKTSVKAIPRTTRWNREVELRLIADMRIVDSRTSAIIATEKGDVQKLWRKMYNSRPSANAPVEPAVLDEIQRDLIKQLVRRVIDVIFPVRVLQLNAKGTVFLNRGAPGGIKVGGQWDVFKPGEALIDPDTGENLGSAETKVARIEVREALAKFSKASIMGGRPRRGFICRPAKGDPVYVVDTPPAPPRPAPDTIAPSIEVLKPVQDAVIDAAPVTISVRVRDDRGGVSGVQRVTINDAEVRGSRGIYAARMSRPREGENAVRVDAWDRAGNKAQVTVRFTYAPAPPPDTMAPAVKVLAPREGQRLNTAPVWAVVSAEDDTGVTRVKINGKAAKRDAKGRWRVKLNPSEGANTIQAVAMDAAGNRGTASSQFMFDGTPPEIDATASLLVEGAVDDLNATLTINGVPVEYDKSTGRYSVRVPPNKDDPGKIVIIATDEFGNQSREVRNVR